MTQKPEYSLGDKVFIREEIKRLFSKRLNTWDRPELYVHEVTGVGKGREGECGYSYILDHCLDDRYGYLHLAHVSDRTVDGLHDLLIKQEQARHEDAMRDIAIHRKIMLEAIRKESV